MKSFIKLVVSITLLIALSHKAFAWESSVYFFKDRYGQEIPVKVSDSGDALNYTFMVHYSVDPESTFYDFVSSTLQGKNYRKEPIDAPCPDCFVSYGESTNQGLRNVPVTAKGSLVNAFIEGVANTLGSRATNEVFNAAKNQPVDNSPIKFVVFHDLDKRKPYAMCSITATGCENVSEVTITKLADSKIAFLLEKVDDMNYLKKIQKIETAIDNYRRSIGYQCRVTLTGSGDNMVRQWTCWPSY